MASDPSSSSQINPLPNSASTVTLASSSSIPYRLVVLNIPISIKLTRGNFLTWRCQIEPALHGHGLYCFLTEDPPSITLTTDGVQSTNPAFSHWYQQDQLLLTWLRSSLSETILNQTASCATSSQLWRLLQQSFSATSRARRTELRRALKTTTKGGSTCLEFCQRLRAIADELAFIGSPVSDDDLVIQILAGFGSEFNSVVAAANAKEILSFADLQAMLLSHEALLSSQLGGGAFSLPSDSGPAAHYSQA